jgi:hypothetical protein
MGHDAVLPRTVVVLPGTNEEFDPAKVRFDDPGERRRIAF